MTVVRKFVVELVMPDGVTIEEMRAYIRDEVRSGVGHRMPEDPLWALDKDTVRVQHLPISSRKRRT